MGSLAQSSGRAFSGVSPAIGEHPAQLAERLREIVFAVNNILLQGKLNCTGSGTLRQNQVTTTLSDARTTQNSVIQLMATSQNAATALGTWFVGTQIEGSFVVSHVSTSTTDCTLFYSIIG
jgi:hypothetical protein